MAQKPPLISEFNHAHRSHQGCLASEIIPQSYDFEKECSQMETLNDHTQMQIVSDNVEGGYNWYQQQVRMTILCLSAQRLDEASVRIMNLTRWLLGNVAKLGELLCLLHVRAS